MLHNLLKRHELFNKPSNIFNMDTSDSVKHFHVEKRGFTTVTSTERDKALRVIIRCIRFLPTARITKVK